MMAGTQSFRRDQDGAIAIIGALCLTALIGMTAMALDLGLAYSRRSALQSATDMAALSASYALTSADASVVRALAGNGISTSATHTTVTGSYVANAAIAQSQRFVANAIPLNAVQVTTQSTSPVLFGRVLTMNSSIGLATTAIATRIDLAGLTAGTTLLSAQTDASVLNGLFTGLLGSNVNLTAASYTGLAAASVSAAQFLPALATQLGLSAGATYGQLAGLNVTMGQIIQAELGALAAGGTTSGAAVTALNGLLAASGSATFPLASLIDVSAWKNEPITSTPFGSALQAQIGLFNLLTDAAQIVGGGGKTISLNLSVLPAGLSSVAIQLAIGAPAQSTPYYSFSPVGASVHTAQVRMMITITLLNTPNLLTLYLPVYIEAASGTATITAISCGANPVTDATVTVLGKTGLATAWVGQVDTNAMTNFATEPTVSKATIAGLLTAPLITGSAGPDTYLSGSSSKVFTQTMIRATPPTSQQYMSTNVSSLGTALGGSNLTITVLGPGLGLTTTSVATALQPALTALDPIVATVLNSLGIGLGKMDVTVNGVRCGVPVLVR